MLFLLHLVRIHAEFNARSATPGFEGQLHCSSDLLAPGRNREFLS